MPELSKHHHIVFLQSSPWPMPVFDIPTTQSITTAVHRPKTLSELRENARGASILILSMVKMNAESLSPNITPNLRYIVILATGTDGVDLDVCRARGIVVSNCPGMNVQSVSEHAMGMYFAARRKIIELHHRTIWGEWLKGTLMPQLLDKDGKWPLSCEDEVVGIIGHGGVGKTIAQLARALGMKVLIAGRKGSMAMKGRVSFDVAISQSTVLFLAIPLTLSSRNYISTEEFKSMSPHTIVVNVSRGGLVNEEALITALQEGQIAGAGTDVFLEEPAGPENSRLLQDDVRTLNLVVSPHLAWMAETTRKNMLGMLKEVVEKWIAGSPINVVL